MALRILTYTGLLELARNKPPEVAGERLPAVLPVVLYNGAEPWTAAPDMGSLITPVGPWQAADDLPYRNPLRAVARLEEASMTLVERVAEWPKQWLREGREQGVAEGREQGREQGVAEGREQGVDQQRALLCRMAAARFDADAAARLAELLAPIADPERLAEVGDWLVRCETAAFFARFDPASPS